MSFRRSDSPTIAAAKVGISTATAYRMEQDPLAGIFDDEIVPLLKTEGSRGSGTSPMTLSCPPPNRCWCWHDRAAHGRAWGADAVITSEIDPRARHQLGMLSRAGFASMMVT